MSVGITNANQFSGINALYHFDGNSTDSSGQGNNGTDTDITYPVVKFGQGASFNGSTSRISLGTSKFNFTSLTIMFWLRNKGTDKTAYLYARNPNADQFANLGIIYVASSLKISSHNEGVSVTNKAIMPFSTLQNGDHLAFVFVSDGTARVYRNGVLVNPTEVLTGFPAWNSNITNETAIGRAGAYDNYYFDGVLDEFVLTNGNLTERQIKDYFAWSLGRRSGVM